MPYLEISPMPAPFLTAEWQMLAMLNYEIDPAVLLPFVPADTELDQWQGSPVIVFKGTRLAVG